MKKSESFCGKKILIYGLGKSGISSYKFLIITKKVNLFDDNKKDDLIFHQQQIKKSEIQKIKFDRIIVSPGIDISNLITYQSFLFKIAKIYTDLDVFYSFNKNTSITITGTNGKSTTAKILHDVFYKK